MNFGFGIGNLVMPEEPIDINPTPLDATGRAIRVSDFCVCVRSKRHIKLCVVTEITRDGTSVMLQPVLRKGENVWTKSRGGKSWYPAWGCAVITFETPQITWL